MVRALASHQCGPGSNLGVDAISGFSLLLVLSCAPRVFCPGTLVFPPPQKPVFPNSNSTRNEVDEEPLCGCATSKSLFIYLFIYLFNEDGAGSNSAVPLTWTDISRQTACFTCGRARLCQLTTHWNYTMYARVCATILKNACWIGSCMQSCTKQGWNFLVPLFNIHNYKRAWVCIRSH